jgi:hypothetical protein
MRREELQVGTRVRIAQPWEIDWVGCISPGATGIVIEVNDDPDDSVIAWVRMDEPHWQLAEWDYILQVHNPDHSDDRGPADLELVAPTPDAGIVSLKTAWMVAITLVIFLALYLAEGWRR